MGLREELIVLRAELDCLRDRIDSTLKAYGAEAAAPIDPGEPIENLRLSRRALTCLNKAGIETVGQLTGKSYRDMWQMNNCGQNTVKDIERALYMRGLSLKGDYLDMGAWRPKRQPRT